MKHLAAIFSFFVLSFATHAQTCTPTWPVGGSDGVMPDSATNLPPAYEGTAYSTSINFKVPHDTTYQYGPIKVAAVVDTIVIDSVTGLSSIPNTVPFKYVANPSTGIFKGDSVGCLLLSGTPSATSAGTYPLTVYVTAHVYLSTLGLYFPETYVISFYRIGIDFAEGISEVTTNEFAILNPQPNPAAQSTKLTYYMPEHGTVNLKVYSILGQLMSNRDLNSQAGLNSYLLQTDDMAAGQYFCTITFKNARQTQELSIIK